MIQWFTNLKFKRISNSRVIDEIDGLRFIAIFLVFLIHLRGIWIEHSGLVYELSFLDKCLAYTINIGEGGVHLFFLISGFILAVPWIKAFEEGKKTPSIKRFYLRRLTRLEPPYVISSILFFFGLIILNKYQPIDLLQHLLATLAYVHNFTFGYGSIINKAAWSLEIEVQFYLLVPIVLPTFYKVFRNRIFMLFLFSLLYSVLLFHILDYNHTGLHKFIHLFVTGIGWAYLYIKHNDWFQSTNYLFDLFALTAFLIGICLNNLYGFYLIQWYILIMVNILMLGALKGTLINKFLKFPFISIVGGMCYSIYLLHGRLISIPVIVLKNYLNTGSFILDYAILFLVIAPVTLLGSGVFYLLIERPCMDPNWYKELLKKTRNVIKV